MEQSVGRPLGRYGNPSPRSRAIVIALSTLLALAFLGWLGWAAWHHSHPDVSGRLQSFDVVSEHQVSLVLDIKRSGDFAVECVVRAQSEDHGIVGETTLAVEAGPEHEVSLTPTMRTDRAATTAVLLGCERV